MKRERQAGQAFILVLILLAIGAMMIVPALRLTDTSLKSSQIIGGRAKSLYACDAAQEYVLWKLAYTNFVNTFNIQDPLDPTKFYSPSGSFTLDVCGTPVTVSVVMRAMATWRGVTLVGNTPIKPTKTVVPNTDPGGQPVTYTIRLEQISSNTSQGLDAVYDILPADFNAADYSSNSSRLSVDGGPWQDVIGDPLIESFGGVERLRWPASGSFASPIRDFSGGQVKEIRFQMASTGLKTNWTYYNWVVLKPWNTLSGATATIVTGTGAKPQGGLIAVTKTAVPVFVQPGVSTNVTYNITITNQQGSTDKIVEILDYLPPGFSYVMGTTSGLTTNDPNPRNFGYVNSVWRQTLDWLFSPNVSIASGATKTLTFKAVTSENVSGSYYNEVAVQTSNPIPNEFSTLGLTYVDFNTGYTWNSAPVIVPAYDSSATSGNVTTNANLNKTPTSASIISYQVK